LTVHCIVYILKKNGTFVELKGSTPNETNLFFTTFGFVEYSDEDIDMVLERRKKDRLAQP